MAISPISVRCYNPMFRGDEQTSVQPAAVNQESKQDKTQAFVNNTNKEISLQQKELRVEILEDKLKANDLSDEERSELQAMLEQAKADYENTNKLDLTA